MRSFTLVLLLGVVVAIDKCKDCELVINEIEKKGCAVACDAFPPGVKKLCEIMIAKDCEKIIEKLTHGENATEICKGMGYCSNATRTAGAYDRNAAMAYADRWWNSTNHDCKTSYTSCSPWSYFGGESCGQSSKGGDCANFVSQCLIAGGHQPLTKAPCRGYPCGKEEVGAKNLGACLAANYGWKSTCGAHEPKPADIVAGDVIIFHKSSCTDTEAHAVLVTKVDADKVYITCHSNDSKNRPVADYASEFGFYQWLHME